VCNTTTVNSQHANEVKGNITSLTQRKEKNEINLSSSLLLLPPDIVNKRDKKHEKEEETKNMATKNDHRKAYINEYEEYDDDDDDDDDSRRNYLHHHHHHYQNEKPTFREQRRVRQQLQRDEQDESMGTVETLENRPGAYASGRGLEGGGVCGGGGGVIIDGSIVVGDIPPKGGPDDVPRDHAAAETVVEAMLVRDEDDHDVIDRYTEQYLERQREDLRREMLKQAPIAQVVDRPDDDVGNDGGWTKRCNPWYVLAACLCCECWIRSFEVGLNAMTDS
jgi:hypothetical protein